MVPPLLITEAPPSTIPSQADVTDPQPKISLARERLSGLFSFELDDWQLYAGGAICEGYNVVVSAPTGAG